MDRNRVHALIDAIGGAQLEGNVGIGQSFGSIEGGLQSASARKGDAGPCRLHPFEFHVLTLGLLDRSSKGHAIIFVHGLGDTRVRVGRVIVGVHDHIDRVHRNVGSIRNLELEHQRGVGQLVRCGEGRLRSGVVIQGHGGSTGLSPTEGQVLALRVRARALQSDLGIFLCAQVRASVGRGRVVVRLDLNRHGVYGFTYSIGDGELELQLRVHQAFGRGEVGGGAARIRQDHIRTAGLHPGVGEALGFRIRTRTAQGHTRILIYRLVGPSASAGRVVVRIHRHRNRIGGYGHAIADSQLKRHLRVRQSFGCCKCRTSRIHVIKDDRNSTGLNPGVRHIVCDRVTVLIHLNVGEERVRIRTPRIVVVHKEQLLKVPGVEITHSDLHVLPFTRIRGIVIKTVLNSPTLGSRQVERSIG